MLIWVLTAAAAIIAAVITVLMIREKGSMVIVEEKESSSAQPVDYDVYFMTVNERVLYTVLAAVIVFAVSYVFYRSIIISLLLSPLAFLYPKYKTREIIRKRKNELNLQFKEALYSLSSSLTAGKSIETAFKDALRDLAVQYEDPNTGIIREFEGIVRRLEMNETVESAMRDFADRAHIEDISSFVDVLHICKRSGGNLVQVIKNSTEIIRDKIEIKQEIDTLLSERKLEQKVLNAMPVFLVMFVSMSAKDFMRPVFTTAAGRIVMTLAIGILAAAYFITKKIMDIEV